MAKNAWAKTRPEGRPYAVVEYDGWTWKILKAYKCRKNEQGDKFARWFCAVTSPMTQGGSDLGDVYCAELPLTVSLQKALAERRELEEAGNVSTK